MYDFPYSWINTAQTYSVVWSRHTFYRKSPISQGHLRGRNRKMWPVDFFFFISSSLGCKNRNPASMNLRVRGSAEISCPKFDSSPYEIVAKRFAAYSIPIRHSGQKLWDFCERVCL